MTTKVGPFEIQRRDPKSGNFVLDHKAATETTAVEFMKKRPDLDLRIVDIRCGCTLYMPELGWERCQDHTPWA